MGRHPEVLWAQRSGKVYLTVSLPDAKDISVKCEAEGFFSFSAVGVSGDPFNFTLQFYGNIAPQGCKTKTGLRNILCSIEKEEKGWWKRLLRSEEKPAPYIKVDWNKWCDEDDEESDSKVGSDDDDIVYTGENEDSSGDEGMLYLPDLEKVREYEKMSGIIDKIEETLGIGDHKDDKKHTEEHKKGESHSHGEHKESHSHGEHKESHSHGEHHEGIVEKMKEKIHGEHGEHGKEEKKKKKKEKKHEHGDEHGHSSSGSDSD